MYIYSIISSFSSVNIYYMHLIVWQAFFFTRRTISIQSLNSIFGMAKCLNFVYTFSGDDSEETITLTCWKFIGNWGRFNALLYKISACELFTHLFFSRSAVFSHF